eukprot:Tbor_TRINITY_DN5836_c1_g1::TRINITY_DN5836_c1_g1_i3::g.7081::m.7081
MPPTAPDPLACVNSNEITDAALLAVSQFITYTVLPHCERTGVPGEDLVCHVVLRMSRELCLEGTTAYLMSITFPETLHFIAKIAHVLGARFLTRWKENFSEMHRKYTENKREISEKGSFAPHLLG